MAALTMARGAFTQAFRPKRLWLVQLVANPILFLSFAGWLLIPVANAWQLALNVGLAVLLAAAGLTLHAGTINHFRDRNSTAPAHAEQPLLRDAFCRSLHHLLAIAACMAKAFCSEAFLRCAGETIQIHGGIGFTWEHDAHLYLKRAKADSIGFGTPDAHRAALASLVNLPAS